MLCSNMALSALVSAGQYWAVPAQCWNFTWLWTRLGGKGRSSSHCHRVSTACVHIFTGHWFCCTTLCWAMCVQGFHVWPVRCGKKKVAVWSMSQFLEVWKCSQWRNIKRWRFGMECLALVLIRNILFITHMWYKKGRISITTVHWKKKYLYYSEQF